VVGAKMTRRTNKQNVMTAAVNVELMETWLKCLPTEVGLCNNALHVFFIYFLLYKLVLCASLPFGQQKASFSAATLQCRQYFVMF
jgi:hypothetical protein